MVRPILEYASAVWDPHTNLNITKLESVQRCATRFCLGDHSTILQCNKYVAIVRPTQSSELTKLTTMYKIINSNLHIPSDSLIPNHHNSRDGYLTQLQCQTDSYKFFLFSLLY